MAVESETFQKAEAEAAERLKAGNVKGGKQSGASRRGEAKSVASVPPSFTAKARDAVAAIFDVSPRSVSAAAT